MLLPWSTGYRVELVHFLLEKAIVIADFNQCLLNPPNRSQSVDLGRSLIRIALRWRYGGILLLLTIVGCRESIVDEMLPAPIRDTVESELFGQIPRVQGGDRFEFRRSGELHYIWIRGVKCPKPGQDYCSQAATATRNMTRGKVVRIDVVGQNESKVEIADVFVAEHDVEGVEGDLNVGLELLRRGLGWFNETKFEKSELYRQAQASAKSKKIGLWSDVDPVPPWNFELPSKR